MWFGTRGHFAPLSPSLPPDKRTNLCLSLWSWRKRCGSMQNVATEMVSHIVWNWFKLPVFMSNIPQIFLRTKARNVYLQLVQCHLLSRIFLTLCLKAMWIKFFITICFICCCQWRCLHDEHVPHVRDGEKSRKRCHDDEKREEAEEDFVEHAWCVLPLEQDLVVARIVFHLARDSSQPRQDRLKLRHVVVVDVWKARKRNESKESLGVRRVSYWLQAALLNVNNFIS